MTFKITAREKEALIKRRKIKAGEDDISFKEIMADAKTYIDFLESGEMFDAFDMYGDLASDKELVDTPPKAAKACEVVVALQTALVDALKTIVAGGKTFPKGTRGNKVIITL